MKKKTGIICIMLLSLLCACSKADTNNNIENTSKIEEDTDKEAELSTSEVIMETAAPKMFDECVEGIYEINEAVEIDLFGNNGFLKGKATVSDVRITKEFEQSISEWTDFVIEDLQIEENIITNDCSIIYIDISIENLSDEDMDYNATSISPLLNNEGELEYAAVDLGYLTDKKSGKAMYEKRLNSGETIYFTVGYIINDKKLDKDIYIDVSGKQLNEGCKLVTLTDKGDK